MIPVFVSLIFLYSLVSRRLERTVATAPIVFAVAGMLTVLMLPGLGAVMLLFYARRLAPLGPGALEHQAIEEQDSG